MKYSKIIDTNKFFLENLQFLFVITDSPYVELNFFTTELRHTLKTVSFEFHLNTFQIAMMIGESRKQWFLKYVLALKIGVSSKLSDMPITHRKRLPLG